MCIRSDVLSLRYIFKYCLSRPLKILKSNYCPLNQNGPKLGMIQCAPISNFIGEIWGILFKFRICPYRERATETITCGTLYCLLYANTLYQLIKLYLTKSPVILTNLQLILSYSRDSISLNVVEFCHITCKMDSNLIHMLSFIARFAGDVLWIGHWL